jgi:hypothetical protein
MDLRGCANPEGLLLLGENEFAAKHQGRTITQVEIDRCLEE